MDDTLSAPDTDPRISTGSEGLDDILGGGLDPNRVYLYEGRPGTGKTTIALQFLLEGVRNGERVLYITLSETRRELALVARRHGWSLEGVDVFELVPPETTLDPEQGTDGVPSCGSRTERNHAAGVRRGSAPEPYPRGDRQPPRNCGCSRRARYGIAARFWR